MVQEIIRTRTIADFPASAPAANPVFFRTYSRQTEAGRESWEQVCDRTVAGVAKLGKLTSPEEALIIRMQQELKTLTSGRWLWIGGTGWIDSQKNFSGGYNCTSTNVTDWHAFALMMDLAMMGCGTGAMLEPKYIEQLPVLRNRISLRVQGEVGTTPASLRREETELVFNGNQVVVHVGDSRQGWVKSYETLLELSSSDRFDGTVEILVDMSDVRPAGETLKGFGGMANPVKLPDMYQRVARILNQAQGRQLNSIECCLLIDEAAVTIVAGNIRRSAGMRQFDSRDEIAAGAKENLWQQDENGNWRIDPERDALRMANHTRVFHRKPTAEETLEAVRKQFYSGEGAIQYAPEAIARANADLLTHPDLKTEFLGIYGELGIEEAMKWLKQYQPDMTERELEHRFQRYGLNPCVTADTWIHTGDGPRQVQSLIGQQHSTYINGELFSTTADGFFFSGIKPVVKLQTKEGQSLRLTANHRVLKVIGQTQKAQYSEWVEAGDLVAGDRVLIHNHRGLQPWGGAGSEAEGWLLGSLIGDGSLVDYPKNHTYQAKLRYWGDTQDVMKEHALALVNQLDGAPTKPSHGTYHERNRYFEVGSSALAQIAKQFGVFPSHKTVTAEVEQGSCEFYCGFLQGLFDADGSVQGSQLKGISVRLAQSDLLMLQAVQRMLMRLGIVSKLYRDRRPAQVRLMPDSDRNLAEYNCKAQHELVIANDNLVEFASLIGFQDPTKQKKLTDLLSNYQRNFNRERFAVTLTEIAPDGMESVYDCTVPGPARFDANGFVAHNCGEIIGTNFHCNLSEVHLNQLDPHDAQDQADAFKAGALSVAALLNHEFLEDRYRQSREWDPIVGVSFTGLFDFFVHAFGTPWLEWWVEGRPDTVQGLEFKQKEAEYLNRWREVVHTTIWEYCDRHNLRRPNRCTTVQPAGTKSLLTGASSGWHPPKAQRFLRRITFRKNDPVAMACIDYGYTIVPSQSDKDENGNLLDDPFDPRCTEWLVEIPTEVSWANLPGADQVDISQFSALAQFDFYMQVQRHYTTHNTSATVELREAEIEPLAQRLYEAIAQDEGYMSAALLARFDDLQTFPRLPFEPIDKATYASLMAAVLKRRNTADFLAALKRYDTGPMMEAGPAGCDSDKCLLPEKQPE